MTRSPNRRRLTYLVVVPAGLIVVAAAALLLVINLGLIPRAVSSVTTRVAEIGGSRLDFGRTTYLPLRGFVVRDVELRVGAHSVVTIPRARFRLEPGLLRRTDELADLVVPTVSPVDAPELILAFAESVAERRALPRLIYANAVSIQAPLLVGSSLDVRDFRMVHSRSDSSIRVTTANLSPTFLDLRIGYGAGEVEGIVSAEFRPIPPHAGDVTTTLSFWLEGANVWRIEGNLGVQNGEFNLPVISDEIIRSIDLSYALAATFNPGPVLSMPEPLPVAAWRADYLEAARVPTGELPDENRAASPTGELVFTRGELTAGETRLEFLPAIRGLTAGEPQLQVKLKLPSTPVDRILAAIPSAVSAELAQTRAGGALAWEIDLRVPMRAISEMVWVSEADLTNLAVTGIHPSMNVYKLNDEFVHTIRDPAVEYTRTVAIPAARPASMEWMLLHSEHTMRQIQSSRVRAAEHLASRPPAVPLPVPADAGASLSGSGAAGDSLATQDNDYRYVYVDEMSPWVIRSILTAEDGDFFFYGGINPVTLADAIELNVEAGEILFGASTITMQLAKMLFLDQKRVFSRKFQELCLVYLMEHDVPVAKERILELYINLAEFGPGVFGIYDASRHYFGRDPGELNAAQATFLASILPAPKSFYQQFRDGRISDAGIVRMVNLYDIMVERGRMTQDEYDQVVWQRPAFTVSSPGSRSFD